MRMINRISGSENWTGLSPGYHQHPQGFDGNFFYCLHERGEEVAEEGSFKESQRGRKEKV